jgi:cell wall-associated NlpC family hydrolase
MTRALDDLRRRWVPDARLGVFEVTLEGPVLAAVTTSADARDGLRALAAEARLEDRVRLLPDTTLGEQVAAIVTAALAPLLAAPRVSASRASEALHGEVLAVLETRGDWLRVRGADGYLGWTHAGYVARGSAAWRDDWTHRATARALGAELRAGGGGGRVLLPLGARLAPRRDGTFELADGRTATLTGGAVRAEHEARVEARLVAAPEWALRWFAGAPYVWGGRTDWGCDCSGLAQAVYAARGVALPRDSDQQLGVGREVPIHPHGVGYEAGDLLFFTEEHRVSHVALWAGAGRIVHSALSRGGVGADDLFGDAVPARRLRDGLVGVRRP